MATETSGTEATETKLTPAERSALQKLAKVFPNAKLFEPKENGKYYGEAVLVTKDHLFQQVGELTVVKHARSAMQSWDFDTNTPKAADKFRGTVLNVAYEGNKSQVSIADPDRWLERTARTPANEVNTAIARSLLGKDVGVYDAPPRELRLNSQYEGVVLAVNNTSLIQRINSRTAIVHEVSADDARKFGSGQQVAVEYKDGAAPSVAEIDRTQSKARERSNEPSQGQSTDRNVDPETAKRNSFFLARNVVRNGYGSDVKIYDATKVSPEGQFKGTVVAVTDHHVMQRVASKSFIAHERTNLDNEVKRGTLVELTYKDGRATAVEMERRRDRQQSQERAAPQRSAPQQSKGMDR